MTSERVYLALKSDLLSGDVLPGSKLEPAGLADRLNSSVTPVRDSLHRLAGEGLVELRTSEGFFVPFVTEPGLRDRYTWNVQLLRLISRSWTDPEPLQKADALPADVWRATRAFFELFGAGSTNVEHERQLCASSDRLATARAAEQRVFSDLEAELRAMAVAFDHAARSDLHKLVLAYHRRRLHATPAIVRALYRT